MDAADFYTGLVADAYAALKSSTFDAARYAAFVREHGEPALEIGCGDGHPLLTLVGAGLDVAGLDSSADMLDRCRADAARRGLHVTLHQARMERMDLGRRYASIYLAGPTFTLLPDAAVALDALRAIGEHLTDDGAALVPLWVPGPTPAADLGRPREADGEGGSLLRYTPRSETYDADARTRTTSVRYERVGPSAVGESVEREWVIHWQTPETFHALCSRAGLSVASLDQVEASETESTAVLRRA